MICKYTNNRAQCQINLDLFLTTGGTVVMLGKDRVDYKGKTLPPPSTRNGRKTAGVHRKPKTNTGLRMRRIVIHFDSCKTRGQAFSGKNNVENENTMKREGWGEQFYTVPSSAVPFAVFHQGVSNSFTPAFLFKFLGFGFFVWINLSA